MSVGSNVGKWAVVTGASDGIGRALVHELAKHNFNILAIGRSSQKMAALVAEFNGATTLEAHVLNFSKPGSGIAIQELAAGKNIQLFSPTAGFGSSGVFDQLDLAKELEMIDVNCRAVLEQTQAFARQFKEQKTGTIVMFSSILGLSGAGTSATYAATKNFIHSFSEGLRSELAEYGVNVLTVCPTITDTGFAAASKMSFSSADSAESVAKGIAANLGKSKTLYPTPRAKFLGLVLNCMPRSARVMVLTRVMSGMQGGH